MATKQLSTCFFSCGWSVPNCRHSNVRFCPLPSHRLHPASCKMRHRNYREFEDIANLFKSNEHVRLILKYDESLSHLIYAAADMFIIPSIFEPCGLTQMIAMRYGCVPIARKTGGLNDSVFDVDDDSIPTQFRNGYTFLNPDEQGLNGALDRALNHFKNNSQSWQQLVQKVMTIDFSWDSSALQYEELYEKSVARARAASSHA